VSIALKADPTLRPLPQRCRVMFGIDRSAAPDPSGEEGLDGPLLLELHKACEAWVKEHLPAVADYEIVITESRSFSAERDREEKSEMRKRIADLERKVFQPSTPDVGIF